MKNKIFRQLTVLALALALVLSLTACVPEIHIHTGSGENENSASQNSTTESNVTEKNLESITSFESKESNSTKETTSTTPKVSSKKQENTTSSQITVSKAKSIALKDAGLSESQIHDYEIELDNDNGVLHYDISFEKNGEDYDYEINAKTGKIISVEKPQASVSKSQISKQKAKSIALKHAGVTANDISAFELELEKDDGVWKYEISFNVGRTEYDYTINAENGKIIESEKDIND